MKKLTLEATDENVLNSIRNNTYNQREDIKEFVESLDMIEGNAFISLDARWGEGKTFYVRQIEKTIEYTVKKKWGDPEDITELKPYFEDTTLDSVELKQSYFPIYYNAWLYDNHNDPLMSLIFCIIKTCGRYIDSKIDEKTVKDKVCSLLSSISLGIGGVNVSIDAEKINNAFSKTNILKEILTAEEVRNTVKEIFDEVIVGYGQKLLIFIDELDRCKPNFAIEMLERIKHYFDDDRIIFIVSVNKEQLVHTISKYYGSGFDSTGYLNKFFDLNVHMPVIENRDMLFEEYFQEQYWLKKISEELNDYYKLTLRDSLIFKQRISKLPLGQVQDFTLSGSCLSAFIPIIAILDIVDVEEKVKFLNGSSDLLQVLPAYIPSLYRMYCNLGTSGNVDNENFTIGYENIKEVYDYNFGTKSLESNQNLKLDGCRNLKKICIKLCGEIKK